MPLRFLQPGITTSMRFNCLTWPAQSFFVRLITAVDDFGRCEAHTLLLARTLFPFGGPAGGVVKESHVGEWLAEMAAKEMVELYEAGGKHYLRLLRWRERPRSKSKYPPPPSCYDLTTPDRDCEHLRADASNCLQPPANAASPPSPSPSPSPSPLVREREGRASHVNPQGSKAQWGALNQIIAERAKDNLDEEGVQKLKKMRRVLKKIRDKQGRGDFSLTDLSEFGL